MASSVSEQEEHLVAELETVGIRYLSRQTEEQAVQARPPEQLLADLVRQPTSRVRTAVIAVLLADPAISRFVPLAVRRLNSSEANTLKLFYTAAFTLQRLYAARLQPFLGARWQWLPDLYAREFGLSPDLMPDKLLRQLGQVHCQQTGSILNWTGTYQNVAQHLLRQWELESRWKG